MTHTSNRKEEVITMIEEERGGTAFDDNVVTVLKKLSTADLFILQSAFRETYRLGVKSGSDDNGSGTDDRRVW